MLNPSIGLLISIAGILILLRLKLHPGFAIFAGSILLSLTVLPLPSIPSLMLRSLWDYQTIKLLVIIASALTLSRLMEEKGLLAELASAMEKLTPKLAVHLIPAVIGFVPMPGGALVSATASGGLFEKLGLKPEQRTFINYWFRHMWEFSIPVYPSVIATSILLGVPLSHVVITLLPLTALGIAAGAGLSYKILKNTPKTPGTHSRNMLIRFLKASWPVLLLILSILLGLDSIIAFPVTLLLLILQQRARWPELRRAFVFGLEPKILLTLYSVMLYKAAIESSGAAHAVLSGMQNIGLPVIVMLTVLPFIIGMVTAFSVAFVGIALPLLVPSLVSDLGVNNYALILAYTSGMIGLLLSPLHLCLILSAEYFKTTLIKVYKYLLIPCTAIEVIVILVYWLIQ